MDHAKYNAKHNQVVKMLQESKQTFFNQRLNNVDTKMFWKNYQDSEPRLLIHSHVPCWMVTTTVDSESSSAKAACLNNFFLHLLQSQLSYSNRCSSRPRLHILFPL